VLGAFFLLLWLGLGILLRLSYGDGELGSFKHDTAGRYESFSAAEPLVMRVVTATVDPPMDPAKPWERFKSIYVTVTLPDGLSTVVKRLDGDHLSDLRGLGGGRFRDDFPSECFAGRCARTYVLVACDSKHFAGAGGGSMSVYMGAEIVASPDGTTPSSVTMNPSTDHLPNSMAADLARETGCEGKHSAPPLTSGL
jgi:hypothetical protein